MLISLEKLFGRRLMKTQVAIIGSGPAGLMLGHLLRQAGVDVVIVELQSKSHVLSRVRAGLLEESTANVLDNLGIIAWDWGSVPGQQGLGQPVGMIDVHGGIIMPVDLAPQFFAPGGHA